MTTTKIKSVELNKLELNISNPRYEVDYIEELAANIKANGLINPLIVVATENDKYKVIAGNRRLCALRQLQVPDVPCIVKQCKSKQDEAWVILSENIARRDLTPIEIGETLLTLEELGVTQSEISNKIGKSKSYVAKYASIGTIVNAGKLNCSYYDGSYQPTLDELYEISKYDDLTQSDLIAALGTNNWGYELNAAKNMKLGEEIAQKLVKEISKITQVPVALVDGKEGYDNSNSERVITIFPPNYHEYKNIQKMKDLLTRISVELTDTFTLINVNIVLSTWQIAVNRVVTKCQDATTLENNNPISNEHLTQQEDTEDMKRKEQSIAFYQLRYNFIKNLIKKNLTNEQVNQVLQVLAKNIIFEDLDIVRTSNQDKLLVEAIEMKHADLDEDNLADSIFKYVTKK